MLQIQDKTKIKLRHPLSDSTDNEKSRKASYQNVTSIVKDACEELSLAPTFIEQFILPDRILAVKLPVEMDDGSTSVFQGFRVQHNNAKGPYKGGIRFHPDVTLEEVEGLAMIMSIKCALLDLPFGGGKGGVIVDPEKLSRTELERLARAYVRENVFYIGENKDVPAPDLNTNAKIMSWMLDEYNAIEEHSFSTFTGKPVEVGGSKGRASATGRGGVESLEKMVSYIRAKQPEKVGGVPVSKKLLDKINSGEPLTVAVQGFGNVGAWFADIAGEAGYKIVAVSDKDGGIYHPNGLDIKKVIKSLKHSGVIEGCYSKINSDADADCEKISNEELLELEVDVLVPAAIADVIHQDNMKNIKCEILVEMANGPLTNEAQIFFDNKKILLPDVLANAGGVTVSYLEWTQGKSGYWWNENRVNEELFVKMRQAFEDVISKAQSENKSLKYTAYKLGIERILRATEIKS